MKLVLVVVEKNLNAATGNINYLKLFNLSEFATTVIELKAIAKAAITGFKNP